MRGFPSVRYLRWRTTAIEVLQHYVFWWLLVTRELIFLRVAKLAWNISKAMNTWYSMQKHSVCPSSVDWNQYYSFVPSQPHCSRKNCPYLGGAERNELHLWAQIIIHLCKLRTAQWVWHRSVTLPNSVEALCIQPPTKLQSIIIERDSANTMRWLGPNLQLMMRRLTICLHGGVPIKRNGHIT